MSNPNPDFDPENVKEEDIENDCVICDGAGEVEIINTYTDENGYTQTESTGKFKPCPECNEPCDEDDDS